MANPVRVLGFNERGVPEAPTDVVARLRAIDPHLGVHCYRWGVEDQWAIVWRWEEMDPRMARVLAGEIDPATALDILAYVPLEVRPDQIAGYVEPMLKSLSASGMHNYAETVLAKVRAANAQNTAEIWKPTLEKAEEAIETNAGKLFAAELGTVPKVYQTNPATKKKRGRA